MQYKINFVHVLASLQITGVVGDSEEKIKSSASNAPCFTLLDQSSCRQVPFHFPTNVLQNSITVYMYSRAAPVSQVQSNRTDNKFKTK